MSDLERRIREVWSFKFDFEPKVVVAIIAGWPKHLETILSFTKANDELRTENQCLKLRLDMLRGQVTELGVDPNEPVPKSCATCRFERYFMKNVMPCQVCKGNSHWCLKETKKSP